MCEFHAPFLWFHEHRKFHFLLSGICETLHCLDIMCLHCLDIMCLTSFQVPEFTSINHMSQSVLPSLLTPPLTSS